LGLTFLIFWTGLTLLAIFSPILVGKLFKKGKRRKALLPKGLGDLDKFP